MRATDIRPESPTAADVVAGLQQLVAPESVVEQLLTLTDPRNPRRRLPRLIQRLLPDPTHEGGWTRFTHGDLAQRSRAERGLEALRIRVALALAIDDVDAVPAWLLDRLRRLEAA